MQLEDHGRYQRKRQFEVAELEEGMGRVALDERFRLLFNEPPRHSRRYSGATRVCEPPQVKVTWSQALGTIVV